MKSKYLFLAFAASAALVGCQNEEVLAPNEADANGKAIDASEIRFAVSKDDAATRAVWDKDGNSYDFYWKGNEQIGVAYIGDAGNEMQSQGVTNYQFVTDSLKLASFKKKANQDRWTGYYDVNFENNNLTLESLSVVQAAYTKANGTEELAQSDLGKSKNAKFKTNNDYIFEGYYAVYYPFDNTYKKKGYIPVKSPESITVKNDLKDNLDTVANYTFSYSKPQPFKAGDKVAEFKLQQLSGLLKLNLRNKTAADIATVQKILIVPSQEFTVSGKLNSVDAAPSVNVISDAKTASAMEVKFFSTASPFIAGNVTLKVYAASDATSTIPVYIPMLPKSGFTGMDVYLINEQGKSIKIVKTANFDITSAGVQPVGIDITSSEFNTWIAYDEESFAAVAQNAEEGSVIELLKPVALKTAVTVAKKVTIQGKAITLNGDGSLAFSAPGTVVKSDIIANGGTLTPTNATFGKLTVNAKKSLTLAVSGEFNEIVNDGTLTLGDGTGTASIDVVKATNNGKLAIKNKAAINPTGSAMDNQGEVYQYVGSVIGAKSLKNAAAATYTCEVVNRVKFDEAVARKATKIVLASNKEYFMIPATGAENITIQFNAEAQLKNETTKNGVTTYVTGVVKAIISNVAESSLGARINQNLAVKNDIVVEEGKKLKILKNRTVNVTGKVILKKEAEFEREQGGADGIEAKVNCSGIETGQGAEWIGGQPNY